MTIIASQANAFPRELYEPLWDDLLAYSQDLISQSKPSFRIASILMADVAHQGNSYLTNAFHLGNDPSWFDHTRDIHNMINILRPQPPLIGIGHSMGGGQLVNLSLFHPRLFHSLILLDPVIQPRTTEIVLPKPGVPPNPNMAALSTFRRDTWPSREAARQAFSKSPFYQAWDPRVFDLWIEHGLTPTPTLLHPDLQPPIVTLTTPPAMEVYQFSRPNFSGYGHRTGTTNRSTHADLDPENPNTYPFYRSEPNRTFKRLEELRPSVLYISGSTSAVSQNDPTLDPERLRRTGTGISGSGGAAAGRVKLVTLEGAGHLVAMEKKGLPGTVKASGEWLVKEMRRWKEEQEELHKTWLDDGRSVREKQESSEEWKGFMGEALGKKRKGKDAKI